MCNLHSVTSKRAGLYRDALDGDIADVKNDPDNWAQARAVMAALVLQRFGPKRPWVHLDILVLRPKRRPGHPQGAEAQGIRALYAMLEARFA